MANSIQTIGSIIRRGYEWYKSTAKAISETIQKWYERYEVHRARLEQHHAYLDGVLDSSLEYTPETSDVELQGRLKSRLDEMEGGHLFEYIKKLSFEERKRYFVNVLLPTVCEEMNVESSFLGWFQHTSTAGFYNEEQKGIAINELFLESDNDYLLRCMINTIIHECKHAMQWEAVAGRNTHGYSEELIAQWRRNFEDYIVPEESDEGYEKQPVEWDATSFAESVYATDK